MTDYKKLLRKYMKHVRGCEGIDFTDRLNESHSGSEVAFAPEEVAELEAVSRGIERLTES